MWICQVHKCESLSLSLSLTYVRQHIIYCYWVRKWQANDLFRNSYIWLICPWGTKFSSYFSSIQFIKLTRFKMHEKIIWSIAFWTCYLNTLNWKKFYRPNLEEKFVLRQNYDALRMLDKMWAIISIKCWFPSEFVWRWNKSYSCS
jgi:hypothetical protein